MRMGQAGAEISSSDIELLLTYDVVKAGEERLSDIGEAYPAYLAEEAFVAMVGRVCRQRTRLGEALRNEILRLKKNPIAAQFEK